jgi:bla regulator protein blaR1
MKKFSTLVFLIAFCLINLYGQTDNKDPLIVINGKISNIKLSSLDPITIESLSISKSTASKDAYGVLAENGVISIITKDYIKTDNQKDQTTKPLVLVDGEVYTNSLDSINVQKIESVTVRKDKSATDLYGKAGENGVIMITTKEKTPDNKQQ